jgi:hypothetical protein
MPNHSRDCAALIQPITPRWGKEEDKDDDQSLGERKRAARWQLMGVFQNSDFPGHIPGWDADVA